MPCFQAQKFDSSVNEMIEEQVLCTNQQKSGTRQLNAIGPVLELDASKLNAIGPGWVGRPGR